MVYYSEGYCKPYRQSMPVIYEKGNDSEYHKVGMACQKGECNLETCECYNNAPETIGEFRLREKRYGE